MGRVGVDVDVDGEGAGGFAPDGYFEGVASEGGGVVLDPGEGEALVVEAQVAGGEGEEGG